MTVLGNGSIVRHADPHHIPVAAGSLRVPRPRGRPMPEPRRHGAGATRDGKGCRCGEPGLALDERAVGFVLLREDQDEVLLTIFTGQLVEPGK